MTDELYPRAVNPVLFYEAYELHRAAGSTFRYSHPKDDNGQPVAIHKASPAQQQRTTILTIAAKLMILERDKLLDQFCVEWLKYRHIPIPEKDNAPSSPTVGVQGSQGTDGSLRSPSGADEGGSDTLHNPSSSSSTQPPGGVTVP